MALALGTESREIGAYTYSVTHLGATAAYKLLTKLSKIVGPAFGAVASGQSVADRVSRAVAELASRLDEAEVESIVKALVAQTSVSGGPDALKDMALAKVFDIHFSRAREGMGNFLKFTMFALEVQFGDFFGEWLAAARQAVEATKAASPSPNTSSGPSGA